jgi:hypothetical protein
MKGKRSSLSIDVFFSLPTFMHGQHALHCPCECTSGGMQCNGFEIQQDASDCEGMTNVLFSEKIGLMHGGSSGN